MPVSATSDVAFLLLIFMMVVSLTDRRTAAGIDPPEARTAVPAAADRGLEIAVDSGGALFLAGLPADAAAVRDAIADLHPDTRLHILADRNTPFADVSAVLDIAQSLGHRTVSLAARIAE